MSGHSNNSNDFRRGYFVAVLVVCLLLSMGGNGLHTWAAWHADVAAGIDRGGVPVAVPVFVAMLAPASVVAMTELLVISYKRNAGRIRTVVTVLAAIVGLIALTMSFAGLAYVFRVIVGLPSGLAYAAPLIIDLPIIAATVALWDVTNQRARAAAHRPAEHAVSTMDTAVHPADVHAAPALDAEPQWPVSTQLNEAMSTPMDAVDTPTIAPLDTRGPVLTEVTIPSVDTVTVSAVDAPLDAPVVTPVDTPLVTPVDTPTAVDTPLDTTDEALAVVEPVDEVVDETGDDRAFAVRVREEARSTLDTEVVAEALRLLDAGQSQRAVAVAVGKSPGTVAKLARAAEEVRAVA